MTVTVPTWALALPLLIVVIGIWTWACSWAYDRFVWPLWAPRFDATLTRESDGTWIARDTREPWLFAGGSSPHKAIKTLIEVRYEWATTPDHDDDCPWLNCENACTCPDPEPPEKNHYATAESGSE